MKKTLIALLALSSIAMAADQVTEYLYSETGTEFNSDFATALSETDWQLGDSYTLSIAITSGFANGQFMKLADNCWLISQTGGGPFFGVNTAGNNQVTKSDCVFSRVTTPFEVRTLTAGEEPLAGWTQNQGGTDSEKRTVGDALYVTVEYSKAAGTSVTYAYSEAALFDAFVMPTTSFDLEKFVMRNDVALGGYGSLTVTHSQVPEPTTGTLSLLALAGLCARRRKH